MQIIVTPRELMDRNCWDDACEILGINVWAVNEGQMASDEQITLTWNQAGRLGLLPEKDDWSTWEEEPDEEH